MTNEAVKPSGGNGAMIALAWVVVMLPLAWGVYNTVIKSGDLLKTGPAVAASAPATATTTSH